MEGDLASGKLNATRRLLLFDLAAKIVAAVVWTRAPGAACALFFGPDLYLLYSLFVPSAQGLLPVHTRFATTQREVWLTFDDGPDEQDTPRILELLDRHRARATFFLIGARAEAQPALVAEILRRGHEVAHHTYSHPHASFWCAPPGRVARELDRGTAALGRGGAAPRRFRSPVGIKSLFLATALTARGLACVGWSIRSFDSLSRDPARVVARILARLRPGAIILLHEGPVVPAPVRVEAVARLLAELGAQGWSCVIPRPEQLR